MLIVVVIILGGFALHGYRKGLVRMVFSLAAFFIAMALASMAAPYAEEFLLKQTSLHETVEEKCKEFLEARAEEARKGFGDAKSRSPLGESEGERNALQTVFGLELPQDASTLFQVYDKDSLNKLEEGQQLFGEWAEFLADMVVSRAAWAISFCIVGVFLGIFIHALDIFTKLPIIEGVNRLSGALFGLIQGLIIVWGIFFLVSFCQESEFGKQVMESIQGNVFLRQLYELNFLEWLAGML